MKWSFLALNYLFLCWDTYVTYGVWEWKWPHSRSGMTTNGNEKKGHHQQQTNLLAQHFHDLSCSWHSPSIKLLYFVPYLLQEQTPLYRRTTRAIPLIIARNLQVMCGGTSANTGIFFSFLWLQRITKKLPQYVLT